MKKLCHSLHFEAFKYPTEDTDKVLAAVSFFIPEKAIKRKKVESFYGPEIIKLTFTAKKNAEIQKILKGILKHLSKKDLDDLKKTLSERLDDAGTFFMRFDRQEALGGKAVLRQSGDVVKISVKVAAFPFSREAAEATLRDLLK